MYLVISEYTDSCSTVCRRRWHASLVLSVTYLTGAAQASVTGIIFISQTGTETQASDETCLIHGLVGRRPRTRPQESPEASATPHQLFVKAGSLNKSLLNQIKFPSQFLVYVWMPRRAKDLIYLPFYPHKRAKLFVGQFRLLWNCLKALTEWRAPTTRAWAGKRASTKGKGLHYHLLSSQHHPKFVFIYI